MNITENELFNKRWKILFVIFCNSFVTNLGMSIVNVALPEMSVKLNVDMVSIEWVVTSFLITLSATVLIFGKLSDIKGRVKVFKYGVVIFLLGSLLGGVTNSLSLIIVARAIQALGVAATMGTCQAIIAQVFPVSERGRALGISGTANALGLMAGPSLGGIIVSAWSWKYLFILNVPIGVIIFILIIKIFPKSETVLNEKFDIKGALLFSIFNLLLFGALVQGQSIGYNNLSIVSAFVIALITFVIFIAVESKIKLPLLDFKIFENESFLISIICCFISFAVISASNIIMPFYFQNTLKLIPAESGLYLMVFPVIYAVVAPLGGYLSDKIGAENVTLTGLTLTSLGLLFMSFLNETSSIIIIITYTVVMAIGNGMFQPPNNYLVMSNVPKDKLTVGASVNGLAKNLGMVLGTSLSTLLLYNRMSCEIGYRVTDYTYGRDDVFIYGMSCVYVSAAVICVIGILLTAIRLFNSKTHKRPFTKTC